MKRTLHLAVVALLVLGLAVSAIFGLNMVQAQGNPPTACYQPVGGKSFVAGSGCTYEFKSGAILEIDSGATVTRDGITDYARSRGGAANLVNNTLVAHDLGTTPTSIVLTPFYAGALTQTLYISASNATSFTVGVETGSVTTITTVYWQASK